MCARTGPFEKYIVFTTADYVRRMGHKSEKDLTINFHKFEKMTHFDWMKLIQSTPPLETTPQSTTQPQHSSHSLIALLTTTPFATPLTLHPPNKNHIHFQLVVKHYDKKDSCFMTVKKQQKLFDKYILL